MGEDMDRRRFLGSLLIAGTSVLMPGCARNSSSEESEEANEGKGGAKEQVTPNEDLMREHGVLERVLLIYEEIMRRGQSGSMPAKELRDSAQIIRHFIEQYHEKLEENYIFPRFEKANRLVDLVHTLKTQHDAGRRITSEIIRIASKNQTPNKGTTAKLSSLMSQFVRMYRPHYARENTVLFPAFPNVVGTKDYRELGEKFEDQEHKLFGKSGFGGMVEKVASIEKTLGVYDLAQFTPR